METHGSSEGSAWVTPHSCASKGNAEGSNVMSRRSSSLVTKVKHCRTNSVDATDLTDLIIPSVSGYLQKENRRGRWQRRFFTMNNAYLNYSKKAKDGKSTISASIDLRCATTICTLVRNGKPTRKFAVQMVVNGMQEECMFLRAKTNEDAAKWVAVLNRRRSYWLDHTYEDRERETAAKQRRHNSGSDGDSSADSQEGAQPHSHRGSFDSFSDDTDTQNRWWQDDTSHQSASLSDEDDSVGFVTGNEFEDDITAEQESILSKLALNKRQVSVSSAPEFVDRPGISDIAEFTNGLLAPRFWKEADHRKLRVRGPTYLDDGRKVQANQGIFKLVAVDMFKTKARVDHIAAHPENRVAHAMSKNANFPFLFIVQIQVPGPPFYSFVMYMAIQNPDIAQVLHDGLGDTDRSLEQTSQNELEQRSFSEATKRLFYNFFRGEDDSIRDDRFKFLPRVVEGPFVVRRGVPSKPAILGHKLKQRYFRGERYLELDIDIGSSVVAWKLTQMSVSYAKLLTVDLAYILQGNTEEELPEEVMGMGRVLNLDFQLATELS